MTDAAISIRRAAWKLDREAERERRGVVATSMARALYPWPALAFETKAFDTIAYFVQLDRISYASHWMQLQILGRNAGVLDDRIPVLFPETHWSFDEKDTRALISVTPFTVDDAILGRIVAFGEANRRLWVDDESLADRMMFRAAMIDCAKETRQALVDDIVRIRAGRSRLKLVDVAPGWFRIERPRDVEAIRRLMAEDKKAGRLQRPDDDPTEA